MNPAGQVKTTNYKREARNANGVPQTRQMIRSFQCRQQQCNKRHKASENTVADVVGQRHGRVPDPCWKNFYKEGSYGSVNHRYKQYLKKYYRMP